MKTHSKAEKSKRTKSSKAKNSKKTKSCVKGDIRGLQKFSKKQLAIIKLDAVADVAAATCKGIIEIVGDKAAVGIMSRGCRHVGLKDGKSLTSFFGVKGKGMARVGYLTDLVTEMSGIAYKNPERYENFLKSINYSCPYARAFGAYGPEIGRLICRVCEQYCQGLADSVGEGYTCRVDKTLAAGDEVCEFIYTKEGAEEKGGALKKYRMPLRLKLFSKTRRIKMATSFIAHLTINTIIAMADVSDMRPVIGIASRSCHPVGVHFGKKTGEYCGIAGDDIETAVRLLRISFATLGMKSKVEEKSKAYAKVKVRSCTLGKMIKCDVDASGISDEMKRDVKFRICEICKQYHLGILHALSPENDLEIPYRISAGDKHCDFIISKTK